MSSLLLAVMSGIATLAWGPERTTFTIDQPATYVTFNSIRDNPNHGDERNFTLARAVDEGTDQWRDSLTVTEDKDYYVRIYVHNNAAENYNLVAENTKAQLNIPAAASNKVEINGLVSADNANPKQIWDQVVFKSDSRKFSIAYIAGSARYFTNANPSEGFAISDNLVKDGVLLGYDKLDGKVPGCFKYSGILLAKVRVTVEKVPNFTVEKKVRLDGSSDWQKSITAKPGDTVNFQVGYKNTGETTQNKVVVKDKLPNGVTYVNGTTTLKNANYSVDNGKAIESNAVISSGIDIGGYTPGSNAYVRFTVTLPQASALSCGENKLINTATVSTENGEKSDTAEVIVNVECLPTECKPGIPEGDPRCEEKCDVPGKEDLAKNDPNCKEDVPAYLPTTGPMEAAILVIAVLAITLGVVYWYKSHEALKNAVAATTDKDGATSEKGKSKDEISPIKKALNSTKTKIDRVKQKLQKGNKNSKK